jgi:hypothetical protein
MNETTKRYVGHLAVLIPDGDDVYEQFGWDQEDDETHALGPLTQGIEDRLSELVEFVPDGTEIILGRDWERCPFGIVRYPAEVEVPLFDVLAFTEDGRIGHGGINQPVMFDTVNELVDDLDDRSVRRLTAAAGRPMLTVPAAGEVELTTPAGWTVHLHVATDADGREFVQLAGADCDLRGDQPGKYYPAPLSPLEDE